MKINQIETRHFRNLEARPVRPGAGLNVLWGDNAQGKTNLLEALYVASCLRSFRATRTREMIRFGEESAIVRCVASARGLERHLEVALRDGGRVARVDGKTVQGTARYLQVGPSVVLFHPDDVQLPRANPSQRRLLVDRAVANLWPDYVRLARDYHKSLQSRNRVLRTAPRTAERETERLLDVYDAQLADLGARVVAARLRYVKNVEPGLRAIFSELFDSSTVGEIRYDAPAELLEIGDRDLLALKGALRLTLGGLRHEDRARGLTTTGPHTHDIDFRLDGRSTRAVGSQGQLRALVLAFKMAQIQHAEQRLGEFPVLLLDDVSSELDASRCAYLFNFVNNIQCQAFVTTARPDLVPRQDESVYFSVVRGRIQPMV